MKTISENACFGGTQGVYSHNSDACGCDMTFGLFLPAEAQDGPVPVLWYLSGLTCTHENAMTKAGAQLWAAEHGIAVVFPDTSPRGEDVADDDAYDLGKGAGFYVNATQEPWAKHYQMWDYLAEELPGLIGENFALDMERQGITGHSMGGHGALTIGLRNPDRFRSISAFSPIVSPLNCPWGDKALGGYLGDDRSDWREYDACALIEDGARHANLLVDQGTADNFLEEQLKTGLLVDACKSADMPADIRMQGGYDHSYYFISSFMAEHVGWHARHLQG